MRLLICSLALAVLGATTSLGAADQQTFQTGSSDAPRTVVITYGSQSVLDDETACAAPARNMIKLRTGDYIFRHAKDVVPGDAAIHVLAHCSEAGKNYVGLVSAAPDGTRATKVLGFFYDRDNGIWSSPPDAPVPPLLQKEVDEFDLTAALAALTPAPVPAPASTPTEPVTITDADAGLKPIDRPVDYYDGLRASDAGETDIAIILWLRAAGFGDARAMLRVADAYESGTSLPQEKLLAAYYRSLAAKFGAQLENDPLAGLTDEERSAVAAQVSAFTPLKIATKPQAGGQTIDDLDAAISAGETDTVNAVLAKDKALVNKADEQGWTPLMYAALARDSSMVDLLLEAGATASGETDDGYNALHVAAVAGADDVALTLIKKGLFALSETKNGATAASFAQKAGHAELASKLKGMEVNEGKALQARLNSLGYDVGTPDGALGPKSRMQLAIFAHGQSVDDRNISQEVLETLFETDELDVWAVVIDFTQPDGNYTSWDPLVFAATAKEAEAQEVQDCKDQGHKNCKVKFSLPQGACIANASTTESLQVWGKAFPSADEAEADAVAQCAAKRGAGCKADPIICVGE